VRLTLAGRFAACTGSTAEIVAYFDGGGVNTSRLVGSGFGFGFGAFFASFLPLSLLPMQLA
jgi:hypothetical protein